MLLDGSNRDVRSERAGVAAKPTLRLAYPLAFKRWVDVIGALVALLILLPLLLLIAGLIALEGRPVIFVQMRPGRHRKPFPCLKFRTMLPDEKGLLREQLFSDALVAEEFRMYGKLKNDPRISRIGGFLRRTSLDELPQFLNVLAGHMSLVGPRPRLFSQLADEGTYPQSFPAYFRVRPGITGPWQVMGRNSLTTAERYHLDARYSADVSFVTDVIYLAKTIPAVLSSRGAF